MARALCCTIEKYWVAAVEAIGSHHTHLGPVSEEDVVFKHRDSKRMWRLGGTIQDYFPEKQRNIRMAIKESLTLLSGSSIYER